MNKKATRLLSVLLAVLMVVTMVPFMALSAAEPVANSADPVVWDGLVPNLNGVEATVEDWIYGTGAAAGETFDFDWYDVHADDIEYDDDSTITIKTAAGFAIFVVWSNVNSTVDGFDEFGAGEGMMHPLTFLSGKTVKLAADIYLNDPAVDPAEWTNEVMPILWDNMDITDAAYRLTGNFVFDGQGHMIYGWNLNTSINYDETNCQNFGWGLFGILPTSGAVTVKNLAMIKEYINLTYVSNTPASTVLDVEGTQDPAIAYPGDSTKGLCTTWVGGIYGFALGQINVYDCIIDVVSVVNGQGNGNFGSGSMSSTSANFSAVGPLHSNNTTYKETVSAENTGAAISDNWNAPRRDFKNLLISCDSTLNFTNIAWAGNGYNAILGIQGWGNTAKLNDILIVKAVLTGGSEKGVTTLKGNTHTGCYGLVAPAKGEWLEDASNKIVALPDVLSAFDTAVKTEVADVRTTFDTWTWSKDTIPMPIEFAAADFIDSQFNNIFKIATPEDMMDWAANAADITAVSLVADIDMAGYDWTPIQTWAGVFEGNGHTISNLTSTLAPCTSSSWNAAESFRGGLINIAGSGLVIKNVAFLNMYVKTFTYWAGSHQGMLVGGYNGAHITFDNVIVAGRNNGGNLVGMFAGRGSAQSQSACSVTINNSAFFCTDPVKSTFALGIAGCAVDSWGTYGKSIVNNFYAVNLPTGELNTGFAANGTGTTIVPVVTNAYATGAQTTPYWQIKDGEGFAPVTYKSTGDAAFYEAIGDRDIVKGDFVGEALPLGDAWTYADGLLPVPKCFDASVAEVLTATNGIKADDAADYLESLGASIRLGTGAEKQGIRFSFATTAALDLLAKNADVMYGVLVAPTALVGGELDVDDEDVALLFANVEGGDAVLDVVDGKFNAALVNFAGVTTGDVRTVSFTVRGFIMVGEDILWLDSYACSAADVAAAYIAEYAGSGDAEAEATIEKIEAIYGDLLAE